MTLTPPRLDDLTWDAMTEAARRRIPAESGGAWTLHAPADPGVTLLELFAYLLEQRLYWLDQVPDELVVAVLRLLGLEPPRPARPAATVLELSARTPDGRPAVVPAGTVFTRDPLERIAFTLAEDVTVLPFTADGPRVVAGGRDRTADLAARRGVPLLPATGGAGEFLILLRRDGAAERPPAGTRLSLLVELAVDGRCPPSWSPDAVDGVPPPAALTWTWFRPDAGGGAAGTAGADVPAEEVADGTAGLRRSGIVSLPLPAAWCAGGPGPDPQEYGLRVRTAAATYPAPPVLLALAANAGAARHRQARTVTDADLRAQLAGWRRLPGQRLALPDAQGLLLDAALRLRRSGEQTRWTAAPAFTFGGPADRVFGVDRDAGALRFGDGLTGAIPVPDPPGDAGRPGAPSAGLRSAATGADEGRRRLTAPGPRERSERNATEPVLVVDYTIGGGAAGNGGRTANWVVLGEPAGPDVLVTARNPVPADGGRDPETVARARRRAGEELRRVHRAVTAADFSAVATATPGVAVARAYVGVGEHPAYPCRTVPGAVTVRVLPAADRDAAGHGTPVLPDPGLLAAVRAHLGEARLIGTELFVCPPRYRTVRLRVDLAGRPADPAAAGAALRAGLRRYLDPLAGGDGGGGWPFGGPLRPSGLLRAAQAAAGDTADVARVAVGLDGAPPAEHCVDVALRPGELPAVAAVELRVAASTGEGGR